MKWIWRVLLKIQSGHDSVHRRTDRQTDGRRETSIPPFQLVEAGVIIIIVMDQFHTEYCNYSIITIIKLENKITFWNKKKYPVIQELGHKPGMLPCCSGRSSSCPAIPFAKNLHWNTAWSAPPVVMTCCLSQAKRQFVTWAEWPTYLRNLAPTKTKKPNSQE